VDQEIAQTDHPLDRVGELFLEKARFRRATTWHARSMMIWIDSTSP